MILMMCNTFLSIVGARLPRFLGGVSCNKASLFLIQRLRDESKERLQWRLQFALLSRSVAAVLLHKIKPKLYAILLENITYNTPYVLSNFINNSRGRTPGDSVLGDQAPYSFRLRGSLARAQTGIITVFPVESITRFICEEYG